MCKKKEFRKQKKALFLTFFTLNCTIKLFLDGNSTYLIKIWKKIKSRKYKKGFYLMLFKTWSWKQKKKYKKSNLKQYSRKKLHKKPSFT